MSIITLNVSCLNTPTKARALSTDRVAKKKNKTQSYMLSARDPI